MRLSKVREAPVTIWCVEDDISLQAETFIIML